MSTIKLKSINEIKGITEIIKNDINKNETTKIILRIKNYPHYIEIITYNDHATIFIYKYVKLRTMKQKELMAQIQVTQISDKILQNILELYTKDIALWYIK